MAGGWSCLRTLLAFHDGGAICLDATVDACWDADRCRNAAHRDHPKSRLMVDRPPHPDLLTTVESERSVGILLPRD